MKTCTVCKNEKDESEFYEKIKGSGKLAPLCKACVKEQGKARRLKNLESEDWVAQERRRNRVAYRRSKLS